MISCVVAPQWRNGAASLPTCFRSSSTKAMIGNPERSVPFVRVSISILSARARAIRSAAFAGITPKRASARARAISTCTSARTKAPSLSRSEISSSLKSGPRIAESRVVIAQISLCKCHPERAWEIFLRFPLPGKISPFGRNDTSLVKCTGIAYFPSLQYSITPDLATPYISKKTVSFSP